MSLPDRQLEILRILLDGPVDQGNLQERLDISASTLHYHVNRMVDDRLVEKKVTAQIGNARVNEISLNPSALQRVRQVLGIRVTSWTLVTGFGALATGYRVPDLVLDRLDASHFDIDRVVCFTSEDAIEKRREHEAEEGLRHVDRYCVYPYEAYRDVGSAFFSEVEGILREELLPADLVLDLTPLSKLYSFRLLELSNLFGFPCCYLSLRYGKEELDWMTRLQLVGEVARQKEAKG